MTKEKKENKALQSSCTAVIFYLVQRLFCLPLIFSLGVISPLCLSLAFTSTSRLRISNKNELLRLYTYFSSVIFFFCVASSKLFMAIGGRQLIPRYAEKKTLKAFRTGKAN